MAAPTTAKFGKFRVLLGTPGAAQTPVAVTSLSNTNPAVVMVGAADIAKFQNGQIVTIAGATGDMASANGAQKIATLDTGAHTFTIDVDLSGAAAPVTTGVTAQPPAPVTYAAPCGFTSKSFTLSKNLQEIDIPNCDDPDAVAWIGRDAQNLSATIAGDGVAAAEVGAGLERRVPKHQIGRRAGRNRILHRHAHLHRAFPSRQSGVRR